MKTKLEKMIEEQLRDAGFVDDRGNAGYWIKSKSGKLAVTVDLRTGYVFCSVYAEVEIWAGGVNDLLLAKKELYLTEKKCADGSWIREVLNPMYKEAWKTLVEMAEEAAQGAMVG